MIYRSDPLQIIKIRQMADNVRSVFKIGRDKPFPMKWFLELMPDIFASVGFEFRIMPNKWKELDEKHPAKMDIANNVMYIREEIYDDMCRGQGFARFTMAHEIGHFFLLRVYGISLYRCVDESDKYPVYVDPEWQADTFAAELLMPYEECLHLSIEEIERRYKVSRAAAETRYRKIHAK